MSLLQGLKPRGMLRGSLDGTTEVVPLQIKGEADGTKAVPLQIKGEAGRH
jgi:hypothetical protein